MNPIKIELISSEHNKQKGELSVTFTINGDKDYYDALNNGFFTIGKSYFIEQEK